MAKPKLQAELTLFDVTNLVVGAIIGADIYPHLLEQDISAHFHL